MMVQFMDLDFGFLILLHMLNRLYNAKEGFMVGLEWSGLDTAIYLGLVCLLVE